MKTTLRLAEKWAGGAFYFTSGPVKNCTTGLDKPVLYYFHGGGLFYWPEEVLYYWPGGACTVLLALRRFDLLAWRSIELLAPRSLYCSTVL